MEPPEILVIAATLQSPLQTSPPPESLSCEYPWSQNSGYLSIDPEALTMAPFPLCELLPEKHSVNISTCPLSRTFLL